MRPRPFSPDKSALKPSSGVATGLVGRYLFEGGSTLDSSGKQNTGTLSQVTSHNLVLGDSPIGPCITTPSYTGAGNLGSGVVLPTALNISTFTYSAWINPTTTGTATGTIIGHTVSNSAPQFITISGGLTLNKQGVTAIGNNTGGAIVKAGVWQHVAVSFNGSNWAIYYNGVQFGSGVQSASFSFSGAMIIGATSNGFNFNGSIADFQIYNRVVTPAEMLAIYEDAISASSFNAIFSPVASLLFSAGTVTTGALAATETGDSAAFSGVIASSGLLAVTEAADTASLAGITATEGALAANEAPDVASTAGMVGGSPSGIIAATEAEDAASFAGTVDSDGYLAATEGQDDASLSGDVATSGALDASEQPDTASLSGDVPAEGVLAGTEALDIAVISGLEILPQSRLVVIPGIWSRDVSTKGMRLDPVVSVNGAYSKTITTPGLFGERKAS
jgi:hypothetical protein